MKTKPCHGEVRSLIPPEGADGATGVVCAPSARMADQAVVSRMWSLIQVEGTVTLCSRGPGAILIYVMGFKGKEGETNGLHTNLGRFSGQRHLGPGSDSTAVSDQ